MPLQKHLLLFSTFLFSTVFSIMQLHSEPVRSVVSDSIKVNYLSPNQILITDSIINYGKLFLNTPYRHGSGGISSFDCSGFTSFVYRNFGYDLKRSSADQAKQFDTVGPSNLKTGDLVFFSGRRRSKRVGHVGIVVSTKEDGKFNFIHASVHDGVIISNSDEPYYLKRFIKAGRVIASNQLLAVAPCFPMPETKILESVLVDTPVSVSGTVAQTKKVIPAEYHRVKKGETLSTIARKFGMTIAQLKRKNNLHGNKINPRQRLKVKDEETILIAQAVEEPVNSGFQAVESPNQVQSTNINPKLADNQKNNTHTVKKGETLFSISKLYNISVAKLKEFNKIIASKLHPGQQLKINQDVEPMKNIDIAKADNFPKTENTQTPVIAPKAENAAKSVTHKIVAGESLYTIAKMYNISVEDLKKANDLTNAKIKPGQELKLVQNQTADKTVSPTNEIKLEKRQIAKKDETPVIASTHKVRSGESLYTIAKIYNISVEDLKKINNLTDGKIKSGMELKLVQSQSNEITVTKQIKNKPENKQLEKDNSIKVLTHRVKRGENLITIAKENNTSVEELKRINQLSDSKIRFGQELKLSESTETQKMTPAKTENTPKIIHYKVKQGDSFYSIAKTYGCKMDELKEWNKKSSSKIKPGERIVVYQRAN